MKSKLLFLILLVSALSCAHAQQLNEEAKEQPQTIPASAKLNSHKNDAANLKTQNNNSRRVNSSDYVRPDSKKRFNRYVGSVVGPVALARNVLGAGFSTWRNSPEEWGKNWEGFGRRVASNFGKSAIRNTTTYALDEAFKLDSAFYRSQKRDFGSRLRNALISPVAARRENGKRVFGAPRVIGTYTASIIAAETWYPRRYNFKDGLRSGTISLGLNAAVNLAKEFILKRKK